VSTSVSTAPLQLVFSDVWGPSPTSFGCQYYYVRFIDDYSKFTWIYFLKKKFDAFASFVNFQKLIERKLDRKILAVQSDWGEGVNMKNLTLSFKHRAYLIMFHALMRINKMVLLKENIVILLK
jgi:hypothetical protein